MSAYSLKVGSVMTAIPETISADASTATALARMEALGVRHLPVMEDEELVGLLSHRDLLRTRAFLDCAPGVVGPTVGDLCTRKLLTAELTDPLDELAANMAEHKVGSALVLDRDELVGIVTTVDLCRCVVDLVARVRALDSSA